MPRHHRLVSVLLLLVLFTLPLGAQTAPARQADASAFGAWLSALWETLSAPLAVLWEADETAAPDPDDGTTTSTDSGDDRGGWDPNG